MKNNLPAVLVSDDELDGLRNRTEKVLLETMQEYATNSQVANLAQALRAINESRAVRAGRGTGQPTTEPQR